MTPGDFQDAICRQFDTLYREGATSGRVMHIALHPYLTGMPYRIGALDAALKYICKHKKIWKATGSEIARHYRAQLKAGLPPKQRSRRGRNRPTMVHDERLTHSAAVGCRRLDAQWTRRTIMRMMTNVRSRGTGACCCDADSRWCRVRAADTVTIGTVGSPSANLWPLFIGIERASSPPRTSSPIWSISSRAHRSSSSSRPARSTCRCPPASSTRSAPSTRARRSRSRDLKCRCRPMPCWPSRPSRA